MPTAELTATALVERLNFLPVPAGTATLGLAPEVADKFVHAYGEIWGDFFCRETPQHHVEVAAFELARYPLTNANYAEFMADHGYHDPQFWTPDGWAWRQRSERTQSASWGDPKYAGADRPVIGVSWFEAMAVACWAALKTGLNVHLPTEAQWEWAARSTNTRSLYPWGGAWDANKLNSGAAGVDSPNHGTTMSVGTFSPAGDGPYGHADLLGQVWEWTNSLYKSYPYDGKDGREDPYSPDRRVLRGGNWSDGKYANRVTTRYLYSPFYADISTGLRLAIGGDFTPLAARPPHDLAVYGRSTFCSDLVETRRWLQNWNVPYRQVNIDLDETAAFRLDKWLGSRTIPTLVVADYASIDPFMPPADADLSHLRAMDRGSMLHEPDEATLHNFLVHNGFLAE